MILSILLHFDSTTDKLQFLAMIKSAVTINI